MVGAVMMIIVAAAAPVPGQRSRVPERRQGLVRCVRERGDAAAVICGGCVSPTFAGEGKGSYRSLRPYRTGCDLQQQKYQPLDPGSSMAMDGGRQGTSVSTLNPRYSVFGLEPTGRTGSTA